MPPGSRDRVRRHTCVLRIPGARPGALRLRCRPPSTARGPFLTPAVSATACRLRPAQRAPDDARLVVRRVGSPRHGSRAHAGRGLQPPARLPEPGTRPTHLALRRVLRDPAWGPPGAHCPPRAIPRPAGQSKHSRTVAIDPERDFHANEYVVSRRGRRRLAHFWYRSSRRTGMVGGLDLSLDHLIGRLRGGRADGALVRRQHPASPRAGKPRREHAWSPSRESWTRSSATAGPGSSPPVEPSPQAPAADRVPWLPGCAPCQPLSSGHSAAVQARLRTDRALGFSACLPDTNDLTRTTQSARAC